MVLASGCVLPTQELTDTAAKLPTSTTAATVTAIPSATAEAQLRVEIDNFMTALVERTHFK